MPSAAAPRLAPWHLLLLTLLVLPFLLAPGARQVHRQFAEPSSSVELAVTPVSDAVPVSSNVNATTADNSTSTLSYRDLIDPDTLQPFGLLVVTNCLAVAVQFLVFGYNVQAQADELHGCKRTLVDIARPVGVILFIAVALVTAWVDFNELTEAGTKPAGWLQVIFMALIVWVTSPNYRAAKAFFATLQTQTPCAIFSEAPGSEALVEALAAGTSPPSAPHQARTTPELKPKYPTFPLLGAGDVPLFPWSAKWFPWYKWLYMVILLPYHVPELGANLVACSTLYCPPRCCITCCLELNLIAHGICLFFWLLLVIVSLGLWGLARDSLAFHWGYEWPPLVMTLVYIWALFVPLLIALIYSTLMMDWSEILRRAQGGTATAAAAEEETKRQLHAGRVALYELQPREEMEASYENWGYQGTEANNAFAGQSEAELADLKTKGLNFWKVSTATTALVATAIVPIMQILIIAVARIIHNDPTTEGYIKAIQDTVCERTLSSYFSYVLGHLSAANVQVVEKIYILWNLL